MDLPQLWIAVTRPDNLVNALATVAAGRESFASCHLLYEESRWWRDAAWEEYRRCFDSVHAVEKIPGCRGLADLPRFYRALAARQLRLARLEIAPADTIITFSGITALSNALVSAYPDVRTILAVTVQKYTEATRPYSLRHFRHTTSGWLENRVLQPRLGLRRTVHLKPWWGRGDGIRLKRLVEPLEEVFAAVLLLSNDGQERPRTAGANVYPAPFPSLRNLCKEFVGEADDNDASQKVVFFGTPFLLVQNLAPDVYAARLNACLDGLRRHYPSPCTLVYRPHPAETHERSLLQLDGFTVEKDGQVAELYFLRHATRIAAVFSVSSTVSRVALNYGLDGYALWRCFPFDDTAAAYFESLMGRVPPEFEVHAPDELPRPYAARRAEETAAGASARFTRALAIVGIGTSHQLEVAR